MLALLALVVTACGSTTGPSAALPPSPPVSPGLATAGALVAKLKAAGLPIGVVVVYTEATDTNHLLGRPHGYVSKANFSDTRVTATPSADPGADEGGSIEVFATAADLQARKAYLDKLAQGASIFAEYDYAEGPALLRLAATLTPSQAMAYDAALKKLL